MSKRESEITIASFTEASELSATPIEEIELAYKGWVSLMVLDTFLVIQRGVEPLFQVYATTDHSLLLEFGNIGDGPMEFSNALSILKQIDFDVDNGSPKLHIADLRRQRILHINLLEKIQNPSAEYESEPLETFSGAFFPYLFFSDENLLLAQQEGFTRLLIYDKNTRQSRFIRAEPTLPFQIHPDLWSFVYRSSAVLNKEANLIALAPTLLGQVDFFTLSGEYRFSMYVDDPMRSSQYLESNGNIGDPPLFYFLSLEAHGDLIYGLNINNPSRNYYEFRPNKKEILVFDWYRNPIHKYILVDGRNLMAWSYDPIHQRFYAFSPDEDQHHVVMYQITSPDLK